LLFLLVVLAPHPFPEQVIERLVTSSYAASAPLISECYPFALSGDEYLAIECSDGPVMNLKGWAITDCEGTLRFVSDFFLAPGVPCTISRSLASFMSAFGRSPSIALDDTGTAGKLDVSGTFRLADGGDSLALLSPAGSTVDFVVYGNCTERSGGWLGVPVPTPRAGEVVKRVRLESGLVDSNCAADWTPFREFKYGYTDFARGEFVLPAGAVNAFTSPDCSLTVVLEALSCAKSVVRLCTYEFSSSTVTSALLEAIGRGVRVRILAESVPAGGMDDDEIACLSVLSQSGANVQILVGNASRDIVRHVGTLHSKYLVIDDSRVIILSENFVESGLPTDRLFGNRGWGISMSGNEVAQYVSEIFDSDARPTRKDVSSWTSDSRFDSSATLPSIDPSRHEKGVIGPFTTSNPARIALFLSPDSSLNWPFLRPFLESSSAVKIEQFQVDLVWESQSGRGETQNPLLEALAEASSRGARVEMLLDSSWFNAEMNGAIVAALRSNETYAESRSSFRLLDPRSPISVLHNKGAILDSRFTLISSNNWVHASFAKNREIAALVDSSEVAGYFSNAFLLDWIPDETSPLADAGPDMQAVAGVPVILSATRSSDDRAIASYEWDLDRDGKSEANGTTVEFCPSSMGEHRVCLTVRDAWGNEGSASVNVTVVSPSTNAGDGPDSWGSALVWTLPLLIGTAAFIIRSCIARRQNLPPRKLNH